LGVITSVGHIPQMEEKPPDRFNDLFFIFFRLIETLQREQ